MDTAERILYFFKIWSNYRYIERAPELIPIYDEAITKYEELKRSYSYEVASDIAKSEAVRKIMMLDLTSSVSSPTYKIVGTMRKKFFGLLGKEQTVIIHKNIPTLAEAQKFEQSWWEGLAAAESIMGCNASLSDITEIYIEQE